MVKKTGIQYLIRKGLPYYDANLHKKNSRKQIYNYKYSHHIFKAIEEQHQF